MQVKTRKNPCISLDFFGRIEAFQGVTGKKIKKLGRLSTRLSGCAPNIPDLHGLPSSPGAGHPSALFGQRQYL
jgi:hypothetical protein